MGLVWMVLVNELEHHRRATSKAEERSCAAHPFDELEGAGKAKPHTHVPRLRSTKLGLRQANPRSLSA